MSGYGGGIQRWGSPMELRGYGMPMNYGNMQQNQGFNPWMQAFGGYGGNQNPWAFDPWTGQPVGGAGSPRPGMMTAGDPAAGAGVWRPGMAPLDTIAAGGDGSTVDPTVVDPNWRPGMTGGPGTY